MGPIRQLNEILTPLHVHGARTQEEYEALQRRYLIQLMRAYPSHGAQMPFNAPDGAVVRVTGGKWVVDCVCGNCPSAHPEWDEARCFECGAVYRELTWPDDREELERELLSRPVAARHWRRG